MVLHELATNATKHGALSTNTGRVEVSWVIDKACLKLTWAERGGPVVHGPPAHEGFGNVLTRNSITGQLGGQIRYDWEPTGLIVNLSVSMDRLFREPKLLE